MYEELKPTAENPFFMVGIRDIPDLFPRAFSDTELVRALNRLGETRHDYDMLMETASFEEIDDYYNPGTESIPDDYILEAVVIEKLSKADHRMRAIARVLNKHLKGEEVAAKDPILGTPRKSGKFAYVTVQFPFTDGQVVSVIFHAPEGDRQKIGPDDRVVAFRWLLNKRDITQVVAPEDGADVSLETIGKRISQLVVKNSKHFKAQQKAAAEEKQALEDTQAALKAAEERQTELFTQIDKGNEESLTVYAKLTSALAQLEKQRTINAELEAKLDGLKKAAEHKPEPKPEVPKGKTVNTKNETETPGSAGSGETTVAPPTPTVPTPPEPTPPAEPSFVSTMNDILAGKYSDTKQIGSLLDAAIDEAEANGTMDKYEALLNQAADYLTGLLKRRSEEV